MLLAVRTSFTVAPMKPKKVRFTTGMSTARPVVSSSAPSFGGASNLRPHSEGTA